MHHMVHLRVIEHGGVTGVVITSSASASSFDFWEDRLPKPEVTGSTPVAGTGRTLG